MRVLLVCLSVLLYAAPALAGSPHHPVGYVKRVSGNVTVVRLGSRAPVEVGDPIYERDRFRTGQKSALGFALTDGTRMTTGANSTFTIDKYKFDEVNQDFAFVTHLWEGTYEFISGIMSELAPGATRVVTPTGTVSPDGTRFVVKVEPAPARGEDGLKG